MSELHNINGRIDSDLYEDIPEEVQQGIMGGTTFFHFKDYQVFSGSNTDLDLKSADNLSVYSLQYTEMTVATDVKGWVPTSGIFDVFAPRYALTATPYLFFNSLKI